MQKRVCWFEFRYEKSWQSAYSNNWKASPGPLRETRPTSPPRQVQRNGWRLPRMREFFRENRWRAAANRLNKRWTAACTARTSQVHWFSGSFESVASCVPTLGFGLRALCAAAIGECCVLTRRRRSLSVSGRPEARVCTPGVHVRRCRRRHRYLFLIPAGFGIFFMSVLCVAGL